MDSLFLAQLHLMLQELQLEELLMLQEDFLVDLIFQEKKFSLNTKNIPIMVAIINPPTIKISTPTITSIVDTLTVGPTHQLPIS